MTLRTLISALLASAALASVAAAASEFGTPDEAKAMLERVVGAIKADPAKALADFKSGASGFRDRGLYPYCAAAADGMFTAHPTLMGKSLKILRDIDGKAFGEEILASAKEGAVGEVAYWWWRPGTDTPMQKVAFVTRIGDQVCAVGYYKEN